MSFIEDRDYRGHRWKTSARVHIIKGHLRGKEIFICYGDRDYPNQIITGVQEFVVFIIDDQEIPVLKESKSNPGVKLYTSIVEARKMLQKNRSWI